ncbi:MAG: hypothetical protein HKP61_10635 [Dactylosporangium sp.]|nr:hypothetical protein [Dactylosporangium sp.]NNJ61385.1 hypothetical protein [Dactylosporangium sp.]
MSRTRTLATTVLAVAAALLFAGPAAAAPASTPDAAMGTVATAGSGESAVDLAARQAAPSAPSASRQLAQPYHVAVVNFSGYTFDEVLLAVGRYSEPGIEIFSQGPLRPNSLVQFSVDNCSDIRAYSIGLVIDGGLIGSTGDQVLDSTDGDFCSDIWDIH